MTPRLKCRKCKPISWARRFKLTYRLMLRGLALTHLKRKEEAEKVSVWFWSVYMGADEKCYVLAYRIQPSNPLAMKGIPKFYSEIKNWEKLGRFYESMVQQTYNE